MARIKGSVIGKMRGRLGDLAARIVNGDTILSARPASFRVNRSPVLVSIRNRFRITIQFVRALIMMPYIKRIWVKLKPANMSVYNYLIKINYPHVTEVLPTVNNLMSPLEGFKLPVADTIQTEDFITFDVGALATFNTFSADEKNVVANACICFYDPLVDTMRPVNYIPLTTEVEDYVFNNSFEFNFVYSPAVKNIAGQYQKSIIFLTLVTTDEAGELVQYSQTYSVIK